MNFSASIFVQFQQENALFLAISSKQNLISPNDNSEIGYPRELRSIFPGATMSDAELQNLATQFEAASAALQNVIDCQSFALFLKLCLHFSCCLQLDASAAVTFWFSPLFLSTASKLDRADLIAVAGLFRASVSSGTKRISSCRACASIQRFSRYAR